MKKLIFIAIAGLVCGFTASAQLQKKIEKDFERFSTVKVENYFTVKLLSSDKYSVQINADERIVSYVQAYVKGGTLYLLLDEKGFTKELKKELRQKGSADPVLEADVYMPSLNSLIVSDKCIITHCDELQSDKFTLTASDDAVIRQLKVVCSSADLDASRNVEISSAAFQVSDRLSLKTSNSPKISFSQDGGDALLDLGGSSYLEMKAVIESLDIKTTSSAESHISGTASEIVVDASGSSRTDVEQLEVEDGDVTMTGSSKCYANITDEIKVNLTGGSMLTFKDEPYIEVERIVNSTLIKADDPKRK